MLKERIEQTQMLMMDINKVREQCNALLRELSIDQALLNASVDVEQKVGDTYDIAG